MKTLTIFRVVIIACMLLTGHQTYAGDRPSQLSFKVPTAQQLDIIINVLGEDFVKGEDGAFDPELLVSIVDLNDDKHTDLVVVQKSFCDNHSCEYHFLQNDSGKWKDIAAIWSWDYPYVVNESKEKPCSIIIFDHITDDCLACSPPKPIKYTCKLGNNSIITGITKDEPITNEESRKYKLSY